MVNLGMPLAHDAPMRRVARALERAEQFVDAATVVCELTRELLALDACAVMHHRANGRPALIVDNAAGIDDAHRWACVDEVWQAETGNAQAFFAGAAYVIALPVLESRGALGTLACAHTEQVPREIERDLAMVATQLSVWCARHGVGAIVDVPVGQQLGPRQHEVAQLAARGLTNPEISDQLAISINTVKARLKEVFHRLDVTNRTELAYVLAYSAPSEAVPLGVTHAGSVAISRGP